jgi:hypothetical protein
MALLMSPKAPGDARLAAAVALLVTLQGCSSGTNGSSGSSQGLELLEVLPEAAVVMLQSTELPVVAVEDLVTAKALYELACELQAGVRLPL